METEVMQNCCPRGDIIGKAMLSMSTLTKKKRPLALVELTTVLNLRRIK